MHAHLFGLDGCCPIALYFTASQPSDHLPSRLLPHPTGKLVRSGEGGRGTPFAYTATVKGQGAVAEARQKLQADADLLRSAAATGDGAAEAAAVEAPAGEAAA